MPLQKQSVNINFQQGLDTKTDPFQVAVGKFLNLQNSIFTKAGLLQKRNGFEQLAGLANGYSFLTTFNGNLTAIGQDLASYSQGAGLWNNVGPIYPCDLTTLPLIRSNLSQIQCDSAISSNGLVCTVYIESGGVVSPAYKYAVADSVTGQMVIPPSFIVSSAADIRGSPRVFALGNYFVIVYTILISGTNHLQYFAISSQVPTQITAPMDISTTVTPSLSTPNFDGVVSDNNLYIAWNNSVGGQSIKITYITQYLTSTGTTVFSNAGHVTATTMSVCADASTGNIFAAYYDTVSGLGYIFGVDSQLQPLTTMTAPVEWTTNPDVANVAAVAQDGLVSIYYEVNNAYGYDPSIATNFIDLVTCTSSGAVSSPTTIIRSVGLASKAFILNGAIYFLAAYDSLYQPTYFLLNATGSIIAKLAYSNGGGYLQFGLPSVNVNGDTANIAYLYKDLIIPVNKTVGTTNVGVGVYTQTGINLSSFTLNTDAIATSEIGGNLLVSGGFLWAYDGVQPVEQNFFVWPDSVEVHGSNTTGLLNVSYTYEYVATYEWTDNQGNAYRSAPSIPVTFNILAPPVSFTATTTTSSNVLTVISSFTGLQDGQGVSGSGIPGGTYITDVDFDAGTVTLSAAITGSGSAGVTITITSEVSSATIYVPMLRLTYKVNNPVKIVLYRWSSNQQTFYQVTNFVVPNLNNVTTDYITINDGLSDSEIVGNSILYTNGGVVEDIGPPATSVMALYKSRLFLVDAEDRNLLWYSKQVIEATPVEMSDLFTIYIPPTTAAQGNTGPITALSAMDDKLIIFKKDAIYYLTGVGPDNTGANNDFSDAVFITSTVGCANPNSIVFIPNGLMFQSDKGIWLLGRDLSTNYIGAPVEAYNQYLVESSLNIPGTNQVRFTLNNDTTLMFDYFYQQWGTFVGIPALSSTLYQSLHTFINSYGQVLQESVGTYSDGPNPVLMSFTTSWLNLAGLQGYQRAYFLYLLGSYISPHKLSVQIAYEYNGSPTQSTLISPTNFSGYYGSDPVYGNASVYGGSISLEQWRVHLQQQTCQSMQITVSEQFDSFFGTPAGAGLTLSGINLVVGLKKQYRPIAAAQSVG